MLAEYLGWTQMVLFSIITIPQIIKTGRTGVIDGISISVYYILILANLVALWYAVLINQDPLKVKYLIGIVIGSLYLIVYYYHKKEK